jgi:isopenicillin N synthase-like dioxygenase
MKQVANRKGQRIDARNRDFIRFDQVEKKQDYRLAEAANQEEFDEDYRIKTVDLGRFLGGDEGDRKSFAQDLGRALQEIGFAVLEGHGVDPKIYELSAEKVMELLTRPSLEEKMKFRAQRYGSVNQGYFPLKETSDMHPDLVEGWVFCRRAFDLGDDPLRRVEDFWPFPELEPVFRRMCLEHEKLILPVMQSILIYLGCEEHLFDQKLS